MSTDPALSNNLPKFSRLFPADSWFISDVLAVLMLIPPVQRAFQAAMMKMMMKRQQAMMEK